MLSVAVASLCFGFFMGRILEKYHAKISAQKVIEKLTYEPIEQEQPRI